MALHQAQTALAPRQRAAVVLRYPRGETLVVWAPKPDNRKYLEATVTAYRGNTTVWIGVTNTDRKTPVGQTHEPTRPSPVMTADQVAELALSSDLLLYP